MVSEIETSTYYLKGDDLKYIITILPSIIFIATLVLYFKDRISQDVTLIIWIVVLCYMAYKKLYR